MSKATTPARRKAAASAALARPLPCESGSPELAFSLARTGPRERIELWSTAPSRASNEMGRCRSRSTEAVDQKLVVVVSHDCEFNEGKRNKLLVARIENIPGNLTSEQQEDLRKRQSPHASDIGRTATFHECLGDRSL